MTEDFAKFVQTMMESGQSMARAFTSGIGGDPKAMEKAREDLPAATFCASPLEAAQGCDALVLMTEWDEFRQLNLVELRAAMLHPFLLDTRNLFDATAMASAGIRYKSVGR
mgnify:CR=1 FL=1